MELNNPVIFYEGDILTGSENRSVLPWLKVQPPKIDRLKRRFAIIPSTLDENDEICDPKYSILAKDIQNGDIAARNLRLVSLWKQRWLSALYNNPASSLTVAESWYKHPLIDSNASFDKNLVSSILDIEMINKMTTTNGRINIISNS